MKRQARVSLVHKGSCIGGCLLAALFAWFVECEASPKPAFEIEDAKDKACEIVVAADAIPAEKTAAKLLMSHLPKMLGGVTFKVVNEGQETAAAKHLYVGWTKALVASGINCADWGDEEELIAAREGKLFIAGGRPRGTRYAAADFLDRLGVVVTANDTEFDPILKRLVWAEDIRRRPAFKARYVATPGFHRNVWEFYKFNCYKYGDAAWGGYARYGQYGDCHTFVRYSQEFPHDDPNVFALIRGKRQVPEKAGEKGPICPTYPKTIALMMSELEKDVAHQYELERTKGVARPLYYEISMDDEISPCECPTCQAAEKEDGCYAGVMMRLINPLARRLAELDPQAKLTMLVYQKTLLCPKVTKIEPNVQPRICVHDTEWLINVLAEVCVPIEHPYNAAFMKTMNDWCAKTTSFGIWEYWEYYTKGTFPYIFPKTYADNMRAYKVRGGENILIEIEQPLASFFAYKNWLALRMMDDPSSDMEKLTEAFFRVHYGAAVKPMRAYFDFLADACEKEVAAKAMGARSFDSYAYLNEAFYRTSYGLLAEAEKAVADDARSLTHVRAEYIALDRSVIRPSKKGILAALGFNRKELIARMRRNEHAHLNATFGATSEEAKNRIKTGDAYLDGEAIEAPIPPEVKGTNIFDFKYNAFTYANVKVVDDPDALGGRTLEIGGRQPSSKPDFHRLPFTMGIYNDSFAPEKRVGASLRIDNPPQDEKYHLYHVGKAPIVTHSRIWAHWSWAFFCTPRDAFSMTPDYDSDVWLSVKLQGPAYVKGSQKPNGAFVDRIIIAR